jgi:hypothetical protein
MDHSVPFSVVLIECARVPKVLVELAVSEFVEFCVEIWCKIKHHEEADHKSD